MSILSADKADELYQQLEAIVADDRLKAKEQIPKLRQLLEQLYSHLLEAQADPPSGLFNRMVFIRENYHPPRTIEGPLHELRKLANDTIHELLFVPSKEQFLGGVKALAQGIGHYSGQAVPTSLQEVYLALPEDLELYQGGYGGNLTEKLRGTVIKVEGPFSSKRQTNFLKVLMALEAAENETVLVYLKDESVELRDWERLFSRANTWLLPYTTLQIFDLIELPERENQFATTSKSLIVLEPDLLIDVSQVAQCFFSQGANSRLGLLNRLYPQPANMHLLKGTMVNALLDAYISQPEVSPKEVLDQALEDNLMPAVALDDATIQQVYNDIESRHQQCIQRVATSEFAGRSIRVEPSFFSPKFGLTGRLDALIDTPERADDKVIIELKSGNAPDQGGKTEHEMQLACYDMLFQSVFEGRRNRKKSQLLYSSSSELPLREIQTGRRDWQKVMWVRNGLTADLLRLSQNDHHPVWQITPQQFGHRPHFKDSDIVMYAASLQEATPVEQAYYLHFLSFVIREMLSGKLGEGDEQGQRRGGQAALWQDNFSLKQERHNLIWNLEFDQIDERGKVLRFKRPLTNENNINNFREGDIAILYPQESKPDPEGHPVLRPDMHEVLKCSIKEIGDEHLTVVLWNHQPSQEIFSIVSGKWALEHDFLEGGFNDMLQGLFQFLQAPVQKRALILGINEPATTPFEGQISNRGFENWPGLRPTQASAVKKALSAQDYMLIQGPPGTGKTSGVLARLCGHLFHESEQRVVLAAFTNRAVEEMGEKLRQAGIPYLRLGAREDAQSTHQLARREGFKAARQGLLKSRVILSTATSLGKNIQLLQGLGRLDTLIVDEASQLLEPHLTGLLTFFDRFILVGDQNQMPAVSVQREASSRCEDKNLNQLGIKDLRRSLFERLWNRCEEMGWHQSIATLTDHFRMHDDIALLVNPFYKDRLISVLDRQKNPLKKIDGTDSDKLDRILTSNRLIFFESPLEIMEKRNEAEADRIAVLLDRIAQNRKSVFDPDRTVGVITPWRTQVARIRSRLEDPILQKVTIDTVERFQGSERDIIIISAAVYRAGQVRLLESKTHYQEIEVDRKLNVAISRTREQIIVLGYRPALDVSPHYRRLANGIQEGGIYLDQNASSQLFSPFQNRILPQTPTK